MGPKFTIITPWLPPRQTLARALKCVDDQTYENYEHIVIIDEADFSHVPETLAIGLAGNRKRVVLRCPRWHNMYGNPCRATAFDNAQGEWILYLDDDDILYPGALEVIAKEIEANPDKVWGYFAIVREGKKFFEYPPAFAHITGGQIFHRRVIEGQPVRWGDTNLQSSDWELIEKHLLKHQPIFISQVLGELPKYHWGKRFKEESEYEAVS